MNCDVWKDEASVTGSRLSGSDHGSPISALADKALIDEPHIQLSLLNADFPFRSRRQKSAEKLLYVFVSGDEPAITTPS